MVFSRLGVVYTVIALQMLLAAAVGAVVASRLTGKGRRVCYMGRDLCSWGMAVMAVGLGLPFCMALLQLCSNARLHKRWLLIIECLAGALGAVWWGIFAAVATQSAMQVEGMQDGRHEERTAVWVMAWVETALYLLAMGMAAATAGGLRAFCATTRPASPTAQMMLGAQERPACGV